MTQLTAAKRAEEIETEQNQLIKAETDIEEGWTRLRRQEELLIHMRHTGQNTQEAERLVQLLRRTLIEWERHRALIAERVAYLGSGRASG